MFRLAITAFLSVGIAMSPISATPARAGNDDLARALAALALLGIAGAATAGDRDSRVTIGRQRHSSVQQYRPLLRKYRPSARHRRAHAVRALPARCLRHVRTRRGVWPVFGARCLSRTNVATARLPRRCIERIRFRGRDHAVFDARCLSHSGWAVARRH